ncbi:MAG: zinc ribbon domain-containing protein [Oscillospiraceae bacterium]|jgi:hypothetical protein|nr:zinc ribbon domain-containing protein [Oscillospiraceae bacterium]
MGLLDRAIKNGINRAVGNAVAGAVEKAVAPKVEQAAEQAVQQVIPPTQPTAQQPAPDPAITQQQAQQAGAALGGLFGGLNAFASEAAKNMKICPACGEAAGAQTKFCPKCGGAMPEQTVAQGAACPSCGKQNDIGTKFCADCGAKLPAAVAEEQAAQAKSANAMAEWDRLLPQYPKWQFGGYDYRLERLDDYNGAPYYQFAANGVGRAELEQYRQFALSSGFRPAGQYPDQYQLFKRVDGVVYNIDLEHAFDSDGMSLYFTTREPNGGFDYVKPEPKPKSGGGLFGGLFK